MCLYIDNTSSGDTCLPSTYSAQLKETRPNKITEH